MAAPKKVTAPTPKKTGSTKPPKYQKPPTTKTLKRPKSKAPAIVKAKHVQFESDGESVDGREVADYKPSDDNDNDEEEEKDDVSEDEDEDGELSDSLDSSDEEDVPSDPININNLPTIAKDDASVKRKLDKAKSIPTEDKGVVFISRLPHGFFEDELRGYFSQFGDVTRLRLSRNKKTGRSKHYAFLEFSSSAVAVIVAETMHNYLLTGHILQCKVVPKDKVHPELWVGANKKWRAIPRAQIARGVHNKIRTDEDIDKAEKRLLKRQNERKRKLEEAGIKYDFDAVAYKKKAKTN